MVVSDGLDSFLKYLRETEQLYRIAVDNDKEANDATQDILHSIELEEHKYHEMAKLGKQLKVVRKQRRAAKDLLDQIVLICDWLHDNRSVVKALEQLLGAVRKVESRMGNRIYTPRTKVVTDAFPTLPKDG